MWKVIRVLHAGKGRKEGGEGGRDPTEEKAARTISVRGKH